MTARRDRVIRVPWHIRAILPGIELQLDSAGAHCTHVAAMLTANRSLPPIPTSPLLICVFQYGVGHLPALGKAGPECINTVLDGSAAGFQALEFPVGLQ
jgi:hypothetical protein